MDLLDLWRDRITPRAVLNLIDRLPRTSEFRHELAQDDELAVKRDGESSARPEIPLTEWSPEMEALAAVVDRLAEVISAVVQSQGGKAPQIRPYPRPVTAADRAHAQARREADDALAAQLFPARD